MAKPVKLKFPQSLLEMSAPYFVLVFSLLICFQSWSRFSTKIFLSLDSTVLYYPVYTWVHEHLTRGAIPLISDLVYHGAPVAAVSMAGVLSPVLWLFHGTSSIVVVSNLIFLAPFVIFIFGTYVLGRQLELSVTACLLLAFLWTYNGQRMAQLDHWNIAWACAFFPWAFWALNRHLEEDKTFWLLLAGLFWGLNLLSGHPQVFFLEGLFFFFWAVLSPDSDEEWLKIKAILWMGLAASMVAAPLLLFVGENLSMDGLQFKWGEVDRFYHSWTPFNFITLVFPRFFGTDQYDRQDSDYWWQYQFVEMQVAFSVIGLFFILLFFFSGQARRKWIGLTALFGLLMAFGKFSIVYPLVQSAPLFSFFRDPARYWHLITWVIGLGAAYAWDDWFKDDKLAPKGRRLAYSLGLFTLLFLATGWFFLNAGRPLLESASNWFIRHFLLGDSLHNLPLQNYLQKLPQKLYAASLNINPASPAIFIPLIFVASLVLTVLNRKKWDLDFQKGLLLALVFADLMIFRMPFGNAFIGPEEIPPPAYAAPQNRSLVMLYENPSPLPPQYGEMAYPNMNLVQGRPNLVIDANPPLAGYNQILIDLGWFSWVYKDRDKMGFAKHPELLQILGLDQIVTDIPLKLPPPFKVVQNRYPYVYFLPGTYPKAFLSDQPENKNPTLSPTRRGPEPVIVQWGETDLLVKTSAGKPSALILQKTFLPGWRAFVNGIKTKPFRCNLVLTGVLLEKGNNLVELRYEPVSLRLGFFLFCLFFGVFAFSFMRLRVA